MFCFLTFFASPSKAKNPHNTTRITRIGTSFITHTTIVVIGPARLTASAVAKENFLQCNHFQRDSTLLSTTCCETLKTFALGIMLGRKSMLICCPNFLKLIYSEMATKFCEIFTLLLPYVVPVKSKVKILQNFVAFSEYMNFQCRQGLILV